MATQPNASTTTDSADSKEPKVLTVAKDMRPRMIFDDSDSAAAYIEKCQTDFSDFAGIPTAVVGFTEDGDFDPEVYTDEMRIAVAKLMERGEGPGASTVKAIVIYPTPKLEAILSTDAGTDWLTSILEKELNHVAVRNLRKAESESDIAEAIEGMPTTVADYITSSRESTGGILETYNGLWQIIKKALGQKFKAWALAPLSKKEMRKAIESASYAATVYPTLELRKNKKTDEKESLFEIAANFGKLLAKEQGLDPAFFEKALANRDEKTIDVTDDEDDFDFEAELAKATAPSEDDSGEAATTDEAATDTAAE